MNPLISSNNEFNSTTIVLLQGCLKNKQINKQNSLQHYEYETLVWLDSIFKSIPTFADYLLPKLSF